MNALALIAVAIGATGGVILYVGIRLGMMMRTGSSGAEGDDAEIVGDIPHVDRRV